jgi:hypothetical protein
MSDIALQKQDRNFILFGHISILPEQSISWEETYDDALR